MTREHIFQEIYISFSDSYWYMKCPCDKKELMLLYKIKEAG
jgi:hypothetical protein